MKTTLKNVTLSFPHLFARSEKNDAFGASFLFDADSDAHKAIAEAIQTVGVEKFGPKLPEVLKELKKNGKGGIKVGNDMEKQYDGYADKLFVVTKNKDIRPDVRNRDATPLAAEDGVIYAGAIVNAIVDVSAFENKFGRFIGMQLLGVQFVKDGPRFGGGASAVESDFVPLTNDAEDL